MQEVAAAAAEGRLLSGAQLYLSSRDNACPGQESEAAWHAFFDLYSRRIRKYAFSCGAADADIADCVQEVWAELLVRLPSFRLDAERGQFDTWLFNIVRGKTVDMFRARKRRSLHENSDSLQKVVDGRPSPARRMEQDETCGLAWERLSKKLSQLNLELLRLRLVEERPVAEVAEKLGLSREQVWYRYHRARRDMEQITSALESGQFEPGQNKMSSREETRNDGEFAQGKTPLCVSRNVGLSSLVHQGGHCVVEYVFQRLELGRRELTPEWKVEWICECQKDPRPILYIRKSAIVAYAEICGTEDLVGSHWLRIVTAAVAAGVAAGIATIIATPTAALPIFQMEFRKHLQGKGSHAIDDKIQIALSAKQEPNGPWCICKE